MIMVVSFRTPRSTEGKQVLLVHTIVHASQIKVSRVKIVRQGAPLSVDHAAPKERLPFFRRQAQVRIVSHISYEFVVAAEDVGSGADILVETQQDRTLPSTV